MGNLTLNPTDIHRAMTTSPDPAAAAAELFDGLYNPQASLTLLFCSPNYDLEVLGRELYSRFGDAPVLGCTTAGEISPLGYTEGSISGVTLPKSQFRVVCERIDDLSNFQLAKGDEVANGARHRMSAQVGGASSVDGEHCFGLLVSDGLSMQEEALVASIYRNLGDIQLFGGSAGDGTRFQETFIYHEGRFRRNCAVFTLLHTKLPFRIIKTEHFVASDEKMVVTEADPGRRIVTEINGRPAGREYARVVGLEVGKLTPLIFATYPVVVRIGGSLYVRSIQQVNADESLTFFCAIDTGIVLTVGRGVDMAQSLERAFCRVRDEMGAPQLVLGCDCILRYLECKQDGTEENISRLMRENRVVGFATYGEQFNGMHVNQTFTGVALGYAGG